LDGCLTTYHVLSKVTGCVTNGCVTTYLLLSKVTVCVSIGCVTTYQLLDVLWPTLPVSPCSWSCGKTAHCCSHCCHHRHSCSRSHAPVGTRNKGWWVAALIKACVSITNCCTCITICQECVTTSQWLENWANYSHYLMAAECAAAAAATAAFHVAMRLWGTRKE
jgi:hypothetical protein